MQKTVWLTQLEMAELFDATKQNISLQLKNLFQDGELCESSTVKESLTVQTEGSRQLHHLPIREYIPSMQHPSRILGAPMIALVLTLLGCGADDSSSSRDESPLLLSASLDSFCVQSINAYRATLSLPALQIWSDSQSCFARQARDDVASGKAHSHFGACTERAQNTCPGWSSADNDSARRVVLGSCLRSMWNEGPGSDYSKHGHYINMTSTSYTKVGCGFHQGDGSLWVNMDFR